MNDLLTQQDLLDVTGLKETSHNKISKMSKILENAGIFHWLKHDGTIGTTWHHVHNAAEQKKLNSASNDQQPQFDKIA